MESAALSQLQTYMQKVLEFTEKGKELLNRDEIPLNEILHTKCHSEPEPKLHRETETLAEETLISLEVVLQTSNRDKEPSTQTRLPNLTLPSFDGNILNFREFWDRFNAGVGCRTDIPDVNKLVYLVGCLRGKALDTVKGLATTNGNYKIALNTLTQRFGDKRKVVDAHYTALHNLKRCENLPTECRTMIDEIDRHLRVLESLGEDINASHLRTLMLSKFPAPVVHQHHLTSQDNNSSLAIKKNLERIVAAMEESAMAENTEKPKAETSVPEMTTGALCLKTKKRKNELPSDEQVPRKRKSYAPRKSNSHPTPAKRRKRLPCLFCKFDNHSSAECRKVKGIEARKEKLKGRCLHCLRRNHTTEDCKKKISCFRCKGDHLQIFCPGANSKDSLICADVTTNFKVSNGNSFLQTAVATIRNPNSNKKTNARLLLDSGSQRSYITVKLAKTLGLSSTNEDRLLIYTFGTSDPREQVSPSTEITVVTKRRIARTLQVNVVPHITDRLPVVQNIHGADLLADDGTVGEGVDVLIGNDTYCSFLRDKRIQLSSDLYLLDTDFGFVLSGRTDNNESADVLSVTTYCQCHTPSCPYFAEPDLPLRNIDVKFLWSLENIGITDSPKATRQEEAVRHFNETVKYRNGRYEVKWPWIQFPPDLPSNFGLALGRLKSLVRRLDEESLDEYNTILKEQLDLGIIEEIGPQPQEQRSHPVHYLPHHMVKQEGKRGRIVYDASAKIPGEKSLNETLYSGPSMLEDLTALILQFRTKKIGIVADVEKAFLQVGLQEQDRDVTRFLWIKDSKGEISGDNLVHLRFTRVPFGIISSPFLLNATIRYHMSQSNDNLLKSIAKKCYVDNLVTGANSLQEANQVYQYTRSTFEQLGMNIRDWVSNSKQFMNEIPERHKASQSDNVKVLGLTWKIHDDTLTLKVSEDNLNPDFSQMTKRKLLRTLARVYDPCGFACPLILPYKMLFQTTCERKVKWDAILPEDLTETMKFILKDVKDVMNVELPRYIGIRLPDKDTKQELHCFTDASKNAYAAVVYLKTQGRQQTEVSFVMAKSRISQIKDRDELRIPRLELLGFLIGSRLLRYVKENLDLSIQKEYLWTDSLVVLGWMRSDKLLPPFVANRVNEIKRTHLQTEMRYVPTKVNPADIATRPNLWQQKKDLWYNGPDFLKKDVSDWPKEPNAETDQTLFSVGEALDRSPGEQVLDPQDFLEQDIIPNVPMEIDEPEPLMHEDQGNQQNETTQEVKKIQQEHFLNELAGKKTHLSKNLDLFLDVDGLLRCRGRMANTTWDYDMKYPILLPKDNEFTNNIIKKTHESNYHVGASHTLSLIRKRYWIPHGKSQVQRVIKKCPQCIKHGGGPYRLPAAPALPTERVNYYAPFSFTGIDYFGPLFVSSANGKEKRWVALLTCLTIRAIHLEVVKDLTAEECLLAIRRFAASRGLPKRMYSDNATCFKLTSEVMESPYCIEKRIEWKFIPQLAPWHGGFYERLVALVKHCLKRSLEKHLLNDSQLITVMKEIETVLNSRPLTQVGTETSHILRPADFLSIGKCLTSRPSSVEIPCTGTTAKANLIEGWKKGTKILEEFKKMFINQYLSALRERFQHTPRQPRVKSDRDPRTGDIVQIKSDSKNRENWKIGKIVELIRGADGECRVARVQVEDSIFTRSIGHLYPLEVSNNDSSTAKEQDKGQQDQAKESSIELDLNAESRQAEDMETTPIEVTSGAEQGLEDEGTGHVRDKELDTDLNSSIDVEIAESATEEPQRNGTEERSKRNAAVRAMEKIREWTRHLFTILE